MTGGFYSATTEIFENNSWKVLPYGNLPGNVPIYGMELATVYNEVFSFGKFNTYFKNSFA